MSDIELASKLKNLDNRAKVALGIGALVVAPVVFIAAQALVGALAAVAVAGTLGLGIINFAPVMSMKFANWKLKAIKAEANDNPIETLQNVLIEETHEYKQAEQGVIEFDGELATYDDQLKILKKQYPEEASHYEQISKDMHEYFVGLQQKQEDALVALQETKAEIRKAEMLYKMALAAEKVTSLSQTAEQNVFRNIKQQVAFDAVARKLNNSVAALHSAVRQRPQITAGAK